MFESHFVMLRSDYMKRIAITIFIFIIMTTNVNLIFAENEFIVENGVLTEYNGSGGDIVISR